MTIVWSNHALLRARERGGTWERFKNRIEDQIQAEAGEVWYELDLRRDRDGEIRGVRTNLLVFHPLERSGVLVRKTAANELLVVSVLTRSQYSYNQRTLWFRTYDEARHAPVDRPPPRAVPLRHHPLSKLKKRLP